LPDDTTVSIRTLARYHVQANRSTSRSSLRVKQPGAMRNGTAPCCRFQVPESLWRVLQAHT
jgi:hypothetical protein